MARELKKKGESTISRRLIASGIFLLVGLLLGPGPVQAGAADGFGHPARIGAGLTVGHSYDPTPTFAFYQLTGVLQYDYERIWPHRAPDPLFFRVEGSLGLASYRDAARLMSSVNMLAQYYLAWPGSKRVQPYVEAGIGLIYTDFRNEGQGLRFNFNPQAGIGCDLRTGAGAVWFAGVRLHHLSNGRLYHENRGSNSVLLRLGRYF
jgi:hypothetical protein